VTDPNTTAHADDAEEAPTQDAVDRWVMPYVSDSTLWPVLIVVLAHIAAFIAPVVLFAVRDRHYPAMVAVLGTLYLTYGILRYDLRRFRRPATLSLLALITWITSLLAAYYGGAKGFL
jgi:hypothetical protein